MFKVFGLSTSGLQEISVDGAQLGDRVRYAHSGGLFTIIGKETSGFVIANARGEIHKGQQFNSLSPFTRITPEKNEHCADADEIEALKRAVQDKYDADRRQDEIAAHQKSADYEKFLSQLQKQYPNAQQKGSPHARAARNIKAELKKAFPAVDFSVKSESYSGGNSVQVTWTNGCTIKAVMEITGKYTAGSVNSQEDYYEYDSSAFSKAAGEWLGQAKYISLNREYTDSIKEEVAAAIQKSFNREINKYDLHTLVYRAIQDEDIFGDFTGLDIDAGCVTAKFNVPVPTADEAVQTDAGSETSFKTAEFNHTQKQTMCYAATVVNRVSREEFKNLVTIAKTFGGYYSKYNKDGAVAGFIFSTDEARKQFLELFG